LILQTLAIYNFRDFPHFYSRFGLKMKVKIFSKKHFEMILFLYTLAFRINVLQIGQN